MERFSFSFQNKCPLLLICGLKKINTQLGSWPPLACDEAIFADAHFWKLVWVSCVSFRSTRVFGGSILLGQYSWFWPFNSFAWFCSLDLTVGLLCPCVDIHKTGELTSTILMEIAKVALFCIPVSVLTWLWQVAPHSARTSVPAPVSVVALGKSFLPSETCFVKWRQENLPCSIYVCTVWAYFSWRQWFVPSQHLRWLPKYNYKWGWTAYADFLYYLQKSRFYNITCTDF